jgi:hypothetical protein
MQNPSATVAVFTLVLGRHDAVSGDQITRSFRSATRRGREEVDPTEWGSHAQRGRFLRAAV